MVMPTRCEEEGTLESGEWTFEFDPCQISENYSE